LQSTVDEKGELSGLAAGTLSFTDQPNNAIINVFNPGEIGGYWQTSGVVCSALPIIYQERKHPC
jgi:hypothetical protein